MPPHDTYPFCDTSLPLNDRVNDLIGRLTLEEKPYLLVARESPLGNISRLGIPTFDWGGNCIHGVQSRCTSEGVCPTSFPNPNALGFTFNQTVWRRMGNVIGVELRAMFMMDVGENHDSNLPPIGLDCWSPNINIVRTPEWGRNLETPGEDPLLNGAFGREVTLGLQENPSIDSKYLQAVVTLKHFDANSLEGPWGENGEITRHTVNANISAYDLATTYLPAFRESVVNGNAAGVMCSYNALNGVPACASEFLLEQKLRGEWKFDGYVTSDSGAVKDILESHHYRSNWNETVAAALTAGCDMESAPWPPNHPWATGGPYIDYVPNAVRNGLLAESRLDDALRNVLGLRFRLGLFDPIDDQPFWNKIDKSDVRSDAHVQSAKDATAQSFVLLKNEKNVLPFPAGKRVAVVGPHAVDRSAILGNYLGEICPDATDNCVENPFEAIAKRVGGGASASNLTVTSKGCDVNSNSTAGFQDALDAAKASDYVVYVGGLDGTVERESLDRVHGIGLPGNQADFLDKLLDIGKPTAVVLFHGGILTFDDDLLAKMPALVSAGYPGFYGSEALANALFDGEADDDLAVNRFGKSTVTWYSDKGWKDAEFDVLDFSMTSGKGRTHVYYTGEPEFPFGHGLGYAELERKVSSSVSTDDDKTVRVNVVVTNNDQRRASDDVLLLFARPASGTVPAEAPASRMQQFLVDFERIGPIGPKSVSESFTFNVDAKNFALRNDEGLETFYPGTYEIWVGAGEEKSDPIRVELTCSDDAMERECGVSLASSVFAI